MARARRDQGHPHGRAGADPLADVERVLVDGSNLAFALGRESRGGGPRPDVAVIAAVRAAFPPAVRVEVVFDGSGDRGAGGPAGPGRAVGIGRPGAMVRAASNLYVEHAGRASADRVIEGAVATQLAADGPAGTWGILVVTDDRELRGLVQVKGARVAGTGWLTGRLARVGGWAGPGAAGVGRGPGGRSGTGIGHPRPPRLPRC